MVSVCFIQPQRRKPGSASRDFWDIDFNWIPGGTLTTRSLKTGTICLKRLWDVCYQRWHLVRGGVATWRAILAGQSLYCKSQTHSWERWWWHGSGWLFWKKIKEKAFSLSHVARVGFNIWPCHSHCLELVFANWLHQDHLVPCLGILMMMVWLEFLRSSSDDSNVQTELKTTC